MSTVRQALLRIVLLALAACAVAGLSTLALGNLGAAWLLVCSSFTFAAACALLVPISLLLERPRFRPGGFNLMAMVLLFWVLFQGEIWFDYLSGLWPLEILSFIPRLLVFAVPPAAATLLLGYRWARVSVLVLAIFCVIGFICSVQVWVAGPDAPPWSALHIAGFGALAAVTLIHVGCGDRRHFRWAGLLACMAGIAYALFRLARGEQENGILPDYALMMIWIVALVPAHLNVVLMLRAPRHDRSLMWATMACSIIAGASAILGIPDVVFDEPGSRIFFRMACCFGIAAACGTVAQLVLPVLRRVSPPIAVASANLDKINLECPACHARQLLPVGYSACQACSLRLLVRIFEPQCLSCGYLLYRIATPRCPECGAPTGHRVPAAEAQVTAPAPAISAAPPDAADSATLAAARRVHS